jgi:uncharacterized membrane-anchored protein YhcB (DUF1043 family)
MDIPISIFIGIVFVLMAVLGGFMSSNKAWQKIAFGILGTIGIVLIIFQGSQQIREQENLQGEIKSLKQQLKNESQKHELELEAKDHSETLDKLRVEWMASHGGFSSKMLAGTEMPPRDWINKRLKEMGKNWTY